MWIIYRDFTCIKPTSINVCHLILVTKVTRLLYQENGYLLPSSGGCEYYHRG